VFSLPQEWRRIFSWRQRHRLLVARFTFLVALTSLVALVGTVAIYFLERHAPGTEIKTVFGAFYFTTVQLLTVSSSLKNPLTTGGRVLNILFEIWGRALRGRRDRRVRHVLPERRPRGLGALPSRENSGHALLIHATQVIAVSSGPVCGNATRRGSAETGALQLDVDAVQLALCGSGSTEGDEDEDLSLAYASLALVDADPPRKTLEWRLDSTKAHARLPGARSPNCERMLQHNGDLYGDVTRAHRCHRAMR
jgi:hypothetical protein